jgi:hypothetical protein
MSILDNLGQMDENDWLSQKLEDNPDQDQALQTIARISSAHIWPFLASAISVEDYQARKGVKAEEITYICASVAPSRGTIQTLVDHVMAGFDTDFVTMHQASVPHQAQEEALLEPLLEGLSGGLGGGGDDEGGDDEPNLWDTPKVSSLVHEAPGGGVHGPYKLEAEDGGYDVVNALGESKGHHDTKGEAREQQKAMYANIPEAREQAEEQHEGARRRLAQGDPEDSTTTLLPTVSRSDGDKDNENDKDDEADTTSTFRPQSQMPQSGPSLFETPKQDWELEGSGYYSPYGAGSQQLSRSGALAAKSKMPPGQLFQMDQAQLAQHLTNYHDVYVKDKSHGGMRNAHAQHHRDHPDEGHTHTSLAAENQFEGQPRAVPGASGAHGGPGALGAPFRLTPQQAKQQAQEQDHQNAMRRIDQMQRQRPKSRPSPPTRPGLSPGQMYWAIQNQNRPSPPPQPQMNAPQWRKSSAPHQAADVGYGYAAIPFEALSPEERTQHIAHEHQVDPSAVEGMSALGSAAMHQVLHDEAGLDVEHYHPRGISVDKYGHVYLGAYDPSRDPQIDRDDPFEDYWSEQESGNPEHDVHHDPEEHREHEEADWESAPPAEGDYRGGARRRKPRTSSVKEAKLAMSPQKPPRGPRRPVEPESGYDPSEAFPGYYGGTEASPRRRTAQAPLTGNSDVPADPESSTGASGMFNPAGADAAVGAGGPVSGDFSQSDAPQDIQSQLGQLPTLSHKIGAKLAEMAAEVLTNNPGLTAMTAMELSLRALRLYPKVAAGGTDYLAEPGTEGVPTEVLSKCPQCQWEAYNRQINRCHNCGFWDNALEPSIEMT